MHAPSFRSIARRLREAFRSPVRRKPRRRPLALEQLEDRLTPASASQVGATLTLTLDQLNEQVSVTRSAGLIAFTSTNAITGGSLNAGFTIGGTGNTVLSGDAGALASIDTVIINDTVGGASVVLGPMSTAFDDALTVNLASSGSGPIQFTSNATFTSDVSILTQDGMICSTPPAALSFQGTTASLTSNTNSILLLGSVTTSGTTAFTLGVNASGAPIQAANVLNDFVGPVSVFGQSGGVQLRDANDLALDVVSITGGSGGTYLFSAAGNITDGTSIATDGGRLQFHSDSASITLDSTSNTFGGGVVDLSAAAANQDATLYSSNGFTLGNVSVADQLSVTVGSGTLVDEGGTSSIRVGGASSFKIDDGGTGSIDLANGANRFGGPVTIIQGAGSDVQDVALRNTLATAGLPILSGLAYNDGSINNLTLTFDNTGIALPSGLNIGGNLNVTAGGDITQPDAFSVGGNASFTVLGNHAITLSQNNQILGDVAFNAGSSAQAISFTTANGLTLDTSNFGRGNVSLTAQTIFEIGAVTQQPRGGSVTFTATAAGANIDLSTGANYFTGPLVFSGAGVNLVEVRTGNPLARMADFDFSGVPTMATLGIFFDAAPLTFTADVPASVTTLIAQGVGIFQTAPLTVANANFDARDFIQGSAGSNPIFLTNANNDFDSVALTNVGGSAVSVVDVDDLVLSSVSVGSGRLSVQADGDITETGQITQGPSATRATFTVLNDSDINLGTQANDFTGPVYINANDSQISLRDSNTIELGTVSTQGDFTITNAATVSQAPGTTMSVGGNTSISIGGGVTLDNPGNSFAGSFTFSAGGGGTLRNSISTLLGNLSLGGFTLTSGGAVTQVPGSTIVSTSTTTIDAGTSAITLAEATNNFSTLNLTSTGSAPVNITDVSGLTLGTIRLGTGTFSITSTGSIGESGSLTQASGGGALTFTATGGSSVSLNSSNNDFSGPVIANVNGLILSNRSNLTLSNTSVLSGVLNLTSQGTIDLTGVVLTGLASFSVNARQTTVTTDITSSGSINFIGAAVLGGAGPLTFTATGDIDFAGDVTPSQDLTLNATGDVYLDRGTWNQGAHTLTVIAPNGRFRLADGSSPTDPTARFILTTGTIDVSQTQGMNVDVAGILQVGTNATVAETAFINIGSRALDFIGGALQVGLGSASDKLSVLGTGIVDLGGASAGSRLLGTGLAPATATSVLDAAPGSGIVIVNAFANTLAADGSVAGSFFTGQDTAVAAYNGIAVTLQEVNTFSPTGTVTLTSPDGDKVTVQPTLGAAAHLVAYFDDDGGLIIVVRNNAAASTLTVTTTRGSGDGVTPIHGIGVDGAGSITILAGSSDLQGAVRADGTLTALTFRDVGVDGFGYPSSIVGGGLSSATTILTARVIAGLNLVVPGTLNLKAVAVNGVDLGVATQNRFQAQKFGTITTTGSTALNSAGDLYATLVSGIVPTGLALGSASIFGTVAGTWDINGAIGTYKSNNSVTWNLGASGSAGLANGTGITNITSLNLGATSSVNIVATGAITTITALEWSTGSILAGSIGTITTTPSTAAGSTAIGNLAQVTIHITGNNAGVALSSLNVAGQWRGNGSQTSLLVDSGTVGSITVGRTVQTISMLLRTVGTTAGRLNSFRAGSVSGLTLDARSVGSIAVVGNAAANLFGDFSTPTLTLRGNALGLALGTLSVQHNISNLTLTVLNGNITSIVAGRNLSTANILLPNAANGALGTIQAANWSNVVLSARTIGTLKAVSVPFTTPDSSFIAGDLGTSIIRAYLDNNTATPAIGIISVAGSLGSNSQGTRIDGLQGITSVSIGREVLNALSTIRADAPSGGKIGTLTVGNWTNASLIATSLGTAKITGYLNPQSTTQTSVLGSLSNAKWAIGTMGPTAIGSLAVQGVVTGSSIKALASIPTITIGGSLTGASMISAVAPLASTPGTAGQIGTLTLGGIAGFSAGGAFLRASSFGTIKTVGSKTFNLIGDVTGLDLSARGVSSTGVSIAALSVAGGFHNNVRLTTAGAISSFTVAGGVQDNGTIGVGVDPTAVLANSVVALPLVTVGSFDNTDLFARSIGTFNVAGNTTLGLAGSATSSYIQVFGSNSAATPVAIGSFRAAGIVQDSAFDVLSGNVTSFVVGKFLGSDLLVGAQLTEQGNLEAGATLNGIRSLGTFKTTAPYAGTNATASFADSNVVAARLGTLTLSGVNPDIGTNVLDMLVASDTYGLAFLAGGSGSSGTVLVNGSAVPLTPGVGVPPKFVYAGL